LKAELQDFGYDDIIVVNNPSVDSINKLSELRPNPLQADIDNIRLEIEKLIQVRKDVLIVAHSYGGVPALYASEGLWNHSRKRAGGIIKAILLSSALTLPGQSVADVRMKWATQHMPGL